MQSNQKSLKKIFVAALIFTLLGSLAADDSKEPSPAKELPIAKIIEQYKILNGAVDRFFQERKITDIEKFKRESDQETLQKTNEELQEYLPKQAELMYSALFQPGEIYKAPQGCASIITDVYYDESNFDFNEGGIPPIQDISVSIICESKNPEKIGTFSFNLVASQEVQNQLNTAQYTIIGELNSQLLQPKNRFLQYIQDGIMKDMVIRIAPRSGDKVYWTPSFREKNSGIFTVFGELLDVGKKYVMSPEDAEFIRKLREKHAPGKNREPALKTVPDKNR